jgi:hypothetical protein
MDMPTRADLFDVGRNEVLSRSAARPPGSRITAEEVDTEGSDINILLASASAMGDEVVRASSKRLLALMLDGAEGELLDRLIADRYSSLIVRKDASPAVVTLSFTQPPAGPARVYAVGDRMSTKGGVSYQLTTIATLAAGETGPVTATAEALEAGVQGNAAAGTIAEFGEPQDPGVAVTNPDVAAGGDSTETDERLRERARKFQRTIGKGTVPAIEFGALTVAGVRLATALEETTPAGVLTGRVQLFISDAQGQANSALAAAVSAALIEYRCAGIIVDVIASQPRFESIALALGFKAGVDSTLAFDEVRLLIVSSVNRLAPSATLERSLLFSLARSVTGVVVPDTAVSVPVGDVVPAAGEVIRTRLDLVTAV